MATIQTGDAILPLRDENGSKDGRQENEEAATATVPAAQEQERPKLRCVLIVLLIIAGFFPVVGTIIWFVVQHVLIGPPAGDITALTFLIIEAVVAIACALLTFKLWKEESMSCLLKVGGFLPLAFVVFILGTTFLPAILYDDDFDEPACDAMALCEGVTNTTVDDPFDWIGDCQFLDVFPQEDCFNTSVRYVAAAIESCNVTDICAKLLALVSRK